MFSKNLKKDLDLLMNLEINQNSKIEEIERFCIVFTNIEEKIKVLISDENKNKRKTLLDIQYYLEKLKNKFLPNEESKTIKEIIIWNMQFI